MCDRQYFLDPSSMGKMKQMLSTKQASSMYQSSHLQQPSREQNQIQKKKPCLQGRHKNHARKFEVRICVCVMYKHKLFTQRQRSCLSRRSASRECDTEKQAGEYLSQRRDCLMLLPNVAEAAIVLKPPCCRGSATF